MNTQKVKLHYFNVNSRGSTARALMTYGKIPYEEVYYDYGEKYKNWNEEKQNFTFGFLPCLEVDGKRFFESMPIYFYLCRKIGRGLLGKTPEDEHKILELLCSFENWVSKWYAIGFANEEQKKHKEEHKKVLYDLGIKWLTLYEKLYKENGAGKYYLGDSFTLADFFLANTFAGYFYNNKISDEVFGKELQKVAPNIYKIIERVRGNELKDVLEKTWNKESPI